jgi:hypothetical protein
MHISLIVVAAYAVAAQAFKNTSPFLMFSNAEYTLAVSVIWNDESLIS